MKNRFQSFYLDSPLVNGRIFDLFEAAENVPTQDLAVFFVHGGGWHSGSRTGFHEIMEALGARGYITATTDYRLSGVTAFDQLSDIRESYDWFVKLLLERGHSGKVAVFGSSAGAHLASLMCFAKPGECGEDISRLSYAHLRPVKALLQATPYNFKHWEGMMPPFWAQMQGVAGKSFAEDPERYERLSLCNYVREDNPPVFFMEAGLEHLFPSELTRQIAEKHRQMNIESHWKVYTRVEHGFFYELKRQKQLEAFEDFCAFLQGKLQSDI